MKMPNEPKTPFPCNKPRTTNPRATPGFELKPHPRANPLFAYRLLPYVHWDQDEGGAIERGDFIMTKPGMTVATAATQTRCETAMAPWCAR